MTKKGLGPVTIRELARRLNVSKSTVSLALKDSPLLPASTLKRVKAMAEKCGYRRNPRLARAMAVIANRTPRPGVKDPTFESTLVLLSDWPTAEHWKVDRNRLRHIYQVICRRTKPLGYRVEELWTGSPGMSPRRIEEALKERGTKAVILLKDPSGPTAFDFDLSPYATAVIGRGLASPTFATVDHNIHQGLFECIDQIRRKGYRKPGLIIIRELHDGDVNSRFAAYQCAMGGMPKKMRIPMLLVSANSAGEIRDWIKIHGLDAIITEHAPMLKPITDAGYRIPDDLGAAVLSWRSNQDGAAGIEEQLEAQGTRAVKLVMQQMRFQKQGKLAVSETALFHGVWREGRSLPSRVGPGGVTR